MIFLGIDPGASGGIARYDVECHPTEPDAFKMPDTERDLWEIFADWEPRQFPAFAIIEHVHSMPKQGVASSFKFGRSYGFLRGCLIASGIPFEQVAPNKWLRAVGLPAIKDETRTERLNRVKAKAQELFPSLKITHATGASLLLAEYARRLWAQRNATSS